MSTIIKATCPACGECELAPADLTLMVCDFPPLSYYSFTCPGCTRPVRKPADKHIINLLVTGGIPAVPFTVPAEMTEPHTGPAITWDDVLDFARAEVDWSELAA